MLSPANKVNGRVTWGMVNSVPLIFIAVTATLVDPLFVKVMS
jgi:hypothetical protein